MTTQQPHEFNTGTRCRVSGCNRYHYTCAECNADCTALQPAGPATTDTNGVTRCYKCEERRQRKPETNDRKQQTLSDGRVVSIANTLLEEFIVLKHGKTARWQTIADVIRREIARYNGQPDPEPAPPPPVDLITGPDARYCLDCHQTSLPQRTTCYFCNSARLVPAIKTPCPCCGISQLKPRY
jgi:hypothetical protein